MSNTILIAEDDKDIIELLSLYLSSEGFELYTAENGLQALAILDKYKVDLVIVDIMMPEMNGYSFIKQARETTNLPILVLSAKNMDEDRILGLNLGADAYLVKPFNPLEVVAYVKSALRRSTRIPSEQAMNEEQEKTNHKLIVGELELDLTKLVLRKRDQLVPLTTTELKILMRLMEQPGRVFTKAQLYTCIAGELYESDDNTMMVHISNIRSKIEEYSTRPKYIKTVRGLGYKIEEI